MGHVHGGETAPGIWDEQIRHAITKMAQVHFCATAAAGRRIVRMGEPKSRVHVVGAPALDRVANFWTSNGEIALRVRQDRKTGKRYPAAVVLLHPSGGTVDEEYVRTRRVLDVVIRMVPEVNAVGPNNDPGHEGIVRALQESGVQWEMSVPQERFWHMVVFSSVLVGNSSSGIIEAASLGIPVVNVGTRQAGRERSGNVIDVGWEETQIVRGLKRALENDAFRHGAARRKNVYGDGKASKRIVMVLEGIARDGMPLEKRFAD
jgi:UDP-hydrolysing UDP-N-acetyl-D-glucosamine 2-epimerase